jgi:HK97 family phage portal protein
VGIISQALDALGSIFPERKTAVATQVPTWEQGTQQVPRFYHNYLKYSLEGYSRNEIVFACVEELATSAAEPQLVGVRKTDKGTEQVKDHPILDLFAKPNPFMDRYSLMASVVMYQAISGNAYLEKVRSASGQVVQLWPLRPDRMFVVPDKAKFIRGWNYRIEGALEPDYLPAEDVIHFRSRNPLDDYYGLPPLAVCAERVDTDALMRSFTLSFFRNAAVPAGLLQITKQVNAAERQVIRDRFRMDTGGPQNWHSLMVMNDTEAKYTPMGMPLGQSGIVLPELDEISEARIAMAFGIPLELIGARLGMIHGNRSTTKEARATFWYETLVPKYLEMGATISRAFADEQGADDVDYFEYDLSTVKALQEDEDALHKRVRDDLAAGVISVQEARAKLGHEPEYAPDALLILNRGLEPMSAQAALTGAPAAVAQAQPMAAGQPQQAPGKNGNGNGHVTPAQLQALLELATGKDE